MTVNKKKKPTKRLYLGWKHRGRSHSAFVLVSASKGGGQNIRDVDNEMSLPELQELLKGTNMILC